MTQVNLDFVIDVNITKLTKGVTAAKGNIDALSKSIRTSMTGPGSGNKMSPQLQDANSKALALLETLKKLKDAGKTNLSQVTPAQATNIDARILETKAAYKAARPSAIEDAANKEYVRQQKAAEAAVNAAARASQLHNRQLITQRYALYDVSSMARSASQVFLGFAGATIKAQIAQQQAFASIEKTQVGIKNNSQALKDLKQQLIDLSIATPITFEELSKIGTLGAQLGIQTKDIASFTKVISEFSTITGVGVDETALGFGKLANLLNLNATQYMSLGSAIAGVGVKSAATEQQILNTAGQIAAIGKNAGLTASEIIGLSSALASYKISPYEARGSMQALFRELDASVQSATSSVGKGADRLKVFSSVSQAGAKSLKDIAINAGESQVEIDKWTKYSTMSSTEFAKAWGDKTGGASSVFKSFIAGLGKSNTASVLAKLGLDTVFASKALTSLGNNAQKVFAQMAIAGREGAAGTFLDKAFATQVGTISNKLKELQNSFDAVNAAAASNPVLLQALGGWLDTIKEINRFFADLLAKNDIISMITGFGIALVATVGGMLALVAALAAGGAGFLALRTALGTAVASGFAFDKGITGLLLKMTGLKVVTNEATVATEGFAVATGLAGNSAKVATTGINVFKAAMVTTGIGALVVGLGYLVEWLIGLSQAAPTAAQELDAVNTAIKETNAVIANSISDTQAYLDTINKGSTNLTGFENSLYAMGQAIQNNGNYFGQATQAGRDNIATLASVVSAMNTLSDGNQQTLADNLYAFETALIKSGKGTAGVISYLNTQLEGLASQGFTAVAGAQVDIKALLEGITNAGPLAAIAVKTITDYVAELSGVLSSAFNKRYGVEIARDTITSAWDDIKNSVDAAKASILEANTAMPKLQREREKAAIKVSRTSSRGGAATENALADLADIDAQIAAKQKTLDEANKQVNKTLVGDGADAIKNRSTIRGVIQDNTSYIESLVAAGKPAKFIRSEISRLTSELYANGEASGFSRIELEKYGKKFSSDTKKIVTEMGKATGITLKVNSDPALAAIEEFVAKANKSLKGVKPVTPNVSPVAPFKGEGTAPTSDGSGLVNITKSGKSKPTKAFIDGYHYWKSELKKEQAAKRNPSWIEKLFPAFAQMHDDSIAIWKREIKGFESAYGKGYSTGGFVSGTGGSTSDSIPARLSNGEFVMNAASVKSYGPDFMNALNQQQVSRSMPVSSGIMSSGSSGSQVVYLSPQDRSLLEAAINRPITLQTTDRVIAQSANSGNKELARRGSN